MPSTRTWVIHDSQSKKIFMGDCHVGKIVPLWYPSCAPSSRSVHEAVFSGDSALGGRAQQSSAVGHVAPLTLAWYNLAARPPTSNILGALLTTLLLASRSDKWVFLLCPSFGSDHSLFPTCGASLWIVSTSSIHSPVSGTSLDEIHAKKKSHRRE